MIKLVPVSQITVINAELNLLLGCSQRTRLIIASQFCKETQPDTVCQRRVAVKKSEIAASQVFGEKRTGRK